MALTAGTRLGPYEITTQIGAGGMGEVYRATDTHLKRPVAIKVLPEAVATDGERLARLQREAEVLARLNHPNIAQIYGLEKSDGTAALVMELVEGPTLADRIAQGPIPLDEALLIARQIAQGLEAAHEQGIVHRDLKPANVKVRSDGAVKVLDFGLAKALSTDMGPPSAIAVTNSPTLTSPVGMTGVGIILGTAPYMSPEQARGRAVDKRADLWAFGCVVFEMLAGKRAFDGEEVSDALAAVLRAEPDWMALPLETPPSIQRLLRRALQKDRKQRLSDIVDARLEIEEALSSPASAPLAAAAPKHSGRRRLVVEAVAALGIAAVTAGTVLMITRPAPPVIRRFPVALPANHAVTTNPRGANIAISPDGAVIVYTGQSNSRTMLFAWRMNELAAVPVAGTEGGTQPFLSPDSTAVAFTGDGKLKRVALAGGPVTEICEVSGIVGGSWRGDSIVFFANQEQPGLFRVPAAGGTPERLTSVEAGVSHRFPHVLPGERAVIFTSLPTSGGLQAGRVGVRDLVTGEQRILIEGGGQARFTRTGHLVYGTDGGTIMAVPFDSKRFEITGTPVPFQQGVMVKGSGAVNADIADDGTLVYIQGVSGGAAVERKLVWMSRNGTPTPLVQEALLYARYPAFSPDGKQLAVTLGPVDAGEIWIYDLGGGSQPRKLTFHGHNTVPRWTRDGQRIIFASVRDGGAYRVYMIPADGSVREPQALTNGLFETVSPDGSVVMFSRENPKTNWDLWLLHTADSRTEPYLNTPSQEREAEFSPDGRWVAYVSNETDEPEIWVRPFPGPGGAVRVSADGGHVPVWSRDGKELFFISGSRLMATSIQPSDGFRFTPPAALFDGNFVAGGQNEPRSFTVARDGRFLMFQQVGQSDTATPMIVVLNWSEELKQRVPTR